MPTRRLMARLFTTQLGATLPAGTDTLSVEFTPRDLAAYRVVKKTVTVVVKPLLEQIATASKIAPLKKKLAPKERHPDFADELIEGTDNTLVGDTRFRKIKGNGNTVIGATDLRGNTILNSGGTAIGNDAIAIGAHAECRKHYLQHFESRPWWSWWWWRRLNWRASWQRRRWGIIWRLLGWRRGRVWRRGRYCCWQRWQWSAANAFGH